jgi:hypothetical protein
VGTESSRTVTVRNTGDIDLYLFEFVKTIESSLDAFAVPPFIGSRQLRPGDTDDLSVAFTPKDVGVAQGGATVRLQIAGTAIEQEAAITLRGQGVAPVVQLFPMKLDFGVIPPSSTKTLTLQIENAGDADLVITSLDILNTSHNGAFVIDPSVAFPLAPIIPLSQTFIQIAFNSWTVPGTADFAEFELVSNDPKRLKLQLSLLGMASGPRIELSPDFLDFGQVAIPQTSKVVSIRNRGSSDLAITLVQLNGAREFSATGFPPIPFRVAAGQDQNIEVIFRSVRSGNYQGVLVIESNDRAHPRSSVGVIATHS